MSMSAGAAEDAYVQPWFGHIFLIISRDTCAMDIPTSELCDARDCTGARKGNVHGMVHVLAWESGKGRKLMWMMFSKPKKMGMKLSLLG